MPGKGSGEHGLVTVSPWSQRSCGHEVRPGVRAHGGGGPNSLSPRSAQNRGRLADKRTVALPPARALKKELTPSFSASDGDSDGSGSACGQRPGLKQEDDPRVRIMKRRYFPEGLGAVGARAQVRAGPRGGSPGSGRPAQARRGVLCPSPACCASAETKPGAPGTCQPLHCTERPPLPPLGDREPGLDQHDWEQGPPWWFLP